MPPHVWKVFEGRDDPGWRLAHRADRVDSAHAGADQYVDERIGATKGEIELHVGDALDEDPVSTGLLVVNPPWTLHDELKLLLLELQKPLGQGGAARYRLEFPKA